MFLRRSTDGNIHIKQDSEQKGLKAGLPVWLSLVPGAGTQPIFRKWFLAAEQWPRSLISFAVPKKEKYIPTLPTHCHGCHSVENFPKISIKRGNTLFSIPVHHLNKKGNQWPSKMLLTPVLLLHWDSISGAKFHGGIRTISCRSVSDLEVYFPDVL